MPTLSSRRLTAGVVAGVAVAAVLSHSAIAAAPNGVPFAGASGFNQLVPANPSTAANTPSITSNGGVGAAMAEYTPAVYVSDPADPEFTIRLNSGWGSNALNGMKVRLDPRAQPSPGSDGHMTIVVPDRDQVISLYQADAPSNGVLSATWGGLAPLSGSSANRADSIGGRESGISQLAGLITPDDVRRAVAAGDSGDLGHALALVHDDISSSKFVAPAIRAGGNSGSSGALLMGQRVYLDPAVNVSAIPCTGGDAKAQRFCRIVARTLQRYGAIVVTNGGSGSGFQMVSSISYTSIGQPNPWPDLVGPDRSGYYNFALKGIPGDRMRALDGPGIPGPAQPRITSPTRTPAPATRAPATRAPAPGSGGTGGTGSSGPGGAAKLVTVSRTIVAGTNGVRLRITLRSTATVRVRVRLRTIPTGVSAVALRRALAVRVVRPGKPVTFTLGIRRGGATRVGLAVWIVRPGRDPRVHGEVIALR